MPSDPIQQVIDSFSNVYILWKDKQSVFRGCNENFARLLGMHREDIVGMQDDAAPQIKDDKMVLESGKPKLNMHEQLQLPSGEKISILTQKDLWRDAQGKILGIVVCFIKDPTAA